MAFRNFVAQACLGVSREEHEAFFRKMLADIDEPTAPFGLLDVQGSGSEIEEARQVLEPSLAASIRAQARLLGVSPASVMHLAWALVLARVSGRQEVVFGTVLLGRMQGGASVNRAWGCSSTRCPYGLVWANGRVESVRETHELLARLLRHEHASLALAQRCSGVPAQTPLFLRYSTIATVQGPWTHCRRASRGGRTWRSTGERSVRISVDAVGGRSGSGFTVDGAGEPPVAPQRCAR